MKKLSLLIVLFFVSGWFSVNSADAGTFVADDNKPVTGIRLLSNEASDATNSMVTVAGLPAFPAPADGGMETFDNFTATGSSYTSGTFLGQDGSTWTYTKCRGDSPITGKAIMLGRNQTPQPNFYSGTIAGGIGTISFDYKQAFTTAVNLNVLVNDVVVGNVTATGEQNVIKNSGIINVNVPGDFVLKFSNVNNSDGQVVVDNITWTGFGGGAITATPTFSHISQEYFYPVNLGIACATPDASIYYTTDGSDPDNSSTEYTIPINITSTTTVKAIAYASGFDPSNIASVTLTFPAVTQVNNIADLRDALPGKADYYQITGEVILTFKQSWRNQKYIQDASAAVLIDDNTGKITTVYQVGDGITGIVGTIAEYEGMLQFTPAANPGPATSSGNVIVPEIITIDEMVTNFENYEAELVKIVDVTFNASGNFANGTVYEIMDASKGLGNFRTTFYGMDYIGQPIPASTVNLTGLCNAYDNFNYFTSRSLEDFEFPPTITITSPNGGEQIEQGTQFEINWFVANFTGDVEVVLHTPILKGGVDLGIVPASDGSFTWDVTQDIGEYIIIVKAVGADEPVDMSDETFNIVYPFDIKITEIMYNPSGDDVYEFLEIYNNGLGSVNLQNWHFTKGVVMNFPNMVIAPGEYLVSAFDADAFLAQFGLSVLEWTSGNLNNSGEAVELSDNMGNVRSYVNYDDGGLWPAVCDGEGPSLTFCDPSLSNNDPANWSASVEFAGNTTTVDPLFCTPGTGCGQSDYLANWYPQGWLGISSNLVPSKISMEELWTPAYNNLVIMLGETGVFWPSQNINTIGNWNYEKGYKAKLDGKTWFAFSGTQPVDRTVDVPVGNHLIPVLSEGDALVEDVIVPLGNAVEFMFDIHDGLIYWPAGGILPGTSGSSLNSLIPGYSYLIRVNTPVTIDFGGKSQGINLNPVNQIANTTTWNDVARTGDQHLISVSSSALETLQPGDVIGVFTNGGVCSGMTEFTGTEQVLPLVINGDDITTPNIDGMNSQEMMNIRIFRNGETMDATAIYNPEFENHDGLFAINGLSMISYLKLGATAIGEITSSPTVYPNPGKGLFNISAIGEYKVTVTNVQGQLILSTQINNQGVIDLTGNTGFYFVKFTNDTSTFVRMIAVK